MPRIKKYIDIRYDAWHEVIPDYKNIIDKVIKLTYKNSYLSEIAGNIQHKTMEIYIFLDNDDSLHQKNLIYRNKDKPTNVISVPMFKICYKNQELMEKIMLNQLGDIYISLDSLIKEVHHKEYTDYDFFEDHSYNLMLNMHFAHMICHGFLHLLGYDHINDEDAEIMENIEKKVLFKVKKFF